MTTTVQIYTNQIYTNEQENEFAICRQGDQAMRVETAGGIRYVLEGSYEIDEPSDLDAIRPEIGERLLLTTSQIDNCCEDGAEFECSICGGRIEKGEAHGECVLYAGDDVELGMIEAYHNDCDEAEA